MIDIDSLMNCMCRSRDFNKEKRRWCSEINFLWLHKSFVWLLVFYMEIIFVIKFSERILFYCIQFYIVQCVAPVINWHLAQKLSLTFQDYQWTSMFSTLPPQPSSAFAEGDGQSEARAVWGGDHLLQWHRGVYNPLPLQHPHGGGGHAQRHLQELWQHTWPPRRLQGICGQNAGWGQFKGPIICKMWSYCLFVFFSQQCHA